MGLGFSHGEASWSYGGFNRFRHKLAQQVGIDLDTMEGYGGERLWQDLDTEFPSLIPFLHHSDCEGTLHPARCRAIAPLLRDLVAQWPEGDYDRHQALLLADGMEAAASEGKPLLFI